MSNDNHFPTLYQEYIYLSRYSRWLWKEKRREKWTETVSRYFDFMETHLAKNYNYNLGDDRKKLEQSILSLNVMPSMRALMTSGPALDRDNIAGYNCSYLPIDRVVAFDEILFILSCGSGVGFSVERQFVNKLPEIAEDFHETETTIVVPDSKIGWAKSLRELISLLYSGQIPKWDLSKLRPAGAPLKTFGGRSSGPEPLDDLFRFAVETFKNAAGRKLTSIECHDLVCKIGDTIVSGGVRRSALISLSNLSDDRMRYAKSGQWWEQHPHRSLSNNSAAYTEKPDIGIFMKEWLALYDSKSGERGIFNREAAQKTVPERREETYEYGTNPCGEIILRPNEFCNLTEVVVRESDTLENLKEKIEVATILGTYQSTLTNFRYISTRWKHNCEEERLLGVSLTGIMDHPILSGKDYFETGDVTTLMHWLNVLRDTAISVNAEWAKKFKINQSVAVTCVKPSGTISQMVDSASGIHARHSEYYLRTVRMDKHDPLAKFMKEKGFYVEDDITKKEYRDVFYFPVKSPATSVLRNDLSAVQMLEIWKIYKQNWCEHNPSITISVKEEEWMDVGAWVYDNFDDVCGISFLPYDGGSYKQAPYQEITKNEYDKWLQKMPRDIDWNELASYESTDLTNGARELACTSGECDV